jgi:hypothetical protein
MFVQACHLKFGPTDEGRAKVIWNFFLGVYEDAVRTECREAAEVDSMEAANAAFKAKQDEDYGGGFGAPDPYSSGTIEIKKNRLTEHQNDTIQARQMLTFLRDRFLACFTLEQLNKKT